jgi:hypothetical protein
MDHSGLSPYDCGVSLSDAGAEGSGKPERRCPQVMVRVALEL